VPHGRGSAGCAPKPGRNFQRGAADGLNIVVPHGEPQYYAMRPSINIPRKAVLDLGGFFGCILRSRRFSRCGSSVNWRLCMPPDRPTQAALTRCADLWRPALRVSSPLRWMAQSHSAHLPQPAQKSAFEAIAMGPSIPHLEWPRRHRDEQHQRFLVGGRNPKASPVATTFEAMYDHSSIPCSRQERV